jgi:predicted nuclease of predicted toxin-antitoxin system
MLRCKIDENLPTEAAALLRSAGHECHTVFDEGLSGAPDPAISARCMAEGRVLLTLDLDFADIRTYPPGRTVGIVVFRPVEPDRDRVLGLVRRVLPLLATDSLDGALWIVEEDRIRVRRTDPPAL